MIGNGNNLKTLFRKVYFMLIPTSGKRSKYLIKHKDWFYHIGDKFFFQPRHLPSDPELISFGDNVNVASDVIFINHDIIHSMLNKKLSYETKQLISSNICTDTPGGVIAYYSTH